MGHLLEETMKKAFVVAVSLSIVFQALLVIGKPLTHIGKKERCPVCGMYVAKYESWAAQIKMSDGSTFFFDGVKDMFAFYFEPQKYGSKEKPETFYLKDYYSQQWFAGEKGFFVLGSDVLGPMGHELVPFEKKDAAENFLKDHHGKSLISFSDVTLELINEMRTGKKGHSMRIMKKDK